MASIHEVQKTDTSMADAPGHDKPQTLGTQMQNIGTQVKETVQAAGTQVKETGTECRDADQGDCAECRDAGQGDCADSRDPSL